MARPLFGRYRRVLLLVASLMAACLLASACSSGTDRHASNDRQGDVFTIGMVGEQRGGGNPERGGTLTFAAFKEATLDPAKTFATGSSGGIELAAIYDVLMRYDAGSKKYEPHMAKSLTSSDDYRTWTLSLRQGVTFSDGTPLNAEAVVWSINRFVKQGGNQGPLWSANVTSMRATNPTTVVFHLKRPWPGFVSMFATGPGMIVAKSAVHGDTFTPAGAGPFTVARRAPNEELVLDSRKDYWGGEPYLNKLRFVWLGAQTNAKLDMMNTGAAQAAFLRNPKGVVKARKAGYAGFMNVVSAGNVLYVNEREGRPGSGVTVRKAIAYAINPDTINQRAYDGKGLPGKAMFQPLSRWHTKVKPLAYDRSKARKLLSAAKRNGYDGHLTYVSNQSPTGRAQAVAVKAMLEKVGFDVTLDLAQSSVAAVHRTFIEHDFDLSSGAISVPEASPYRRLFVLLNSTSNLNAMGYSNQKMDRMLTRLQATSTENRKRQVIARIQRHWNATVPAIVVSALPILVTWKDNVHGITPTLDGMILFDHAWLASR